MAFPYFVKPMAISAISAGSSNSATPVTNLTNDEAALVWRSATSTTSTYLVIDIGSAQAVDNVSLLFANLRASDTVRVRAYDSNANAVSGGATGLVSGSDTGALAAYSGTKPDNFKTKAVRTYGSAITARYFRIDIAATGHPDNYIEAMRVVIGKSVTTGRDLDANVGRFVVDPSNAYQGRGYTDFDRYARLPGWRLNWVWIDETTYETVVYPFFLDIGISQPILVVFDPDTPTTLQSRSVYGRVMEQHEGNHPTSAGYQFEVRVVGIAA